MAMKKWKIIVTGFVLGGCYLLPYGAMKLRCSSYSFTPTDPWVGQYPQTMIVSNVKRWGDFAFDWDDPEFDVENIRMNYRDPGYAISNSMKRVLNCIYMPLRLIDEALDGWSVRFRVIEDLAATATGPNKVSIVSLSKFRVD